MSSEQRFADLKRELERNGWKLVRIKGSHHVFEQPGKGILSIPVHHGKVKPVYVRRIQKAIEGD
jgi:predicted RNA binding protein YcfA (HicA-like mRNA interferase family)